MLKIIKLLLVFLFLTIVSVFSLLLSGIKIDSFSFNNINVSQFYIKLDKKLIVDIENIEYKSKKSQVTSSFEDLKKNIELLPNILKIFKKVHIERLKIDGNEFTVSINEEAIYLDNKYVNFSSKFNFIAHQVVFDMYSLHLKDLDLLLDGKVKIDYFNEKLDYFGKYYYQDVNGELKLEMTDKIAQFYINSNKFKSLSFLKEFFRLSVDAEDWMYENVSADIQLEDFYGTVDLERKRVIEKSLKGTAKLYDAKVNFQKGASPVVSKQIDLEFKKGNLYINLLKPKYKDVDINGSFVVIRNLASEKNGVVEVNIKSKSKLNQTILDLLKTYNINIPLIQQTGITSTALVLKVPYLLSKKMSTQGQFIVKDAKIKANNFEFYTKKANVILDGSIIRIKKSDFSDKDMLKATINNLELDTNTLKAKGEVLINSFDVETKTQKILNVKDKKSKINLDFSKAVGISLEDLALDIYIDELINVNIKDLSKIYEYSQVLKENSIKEGNLKLKIKDEKNLTFNGIVSKLNFPLFENSTKLDSLEIKGKVQDSKTYINSVNEKVKLFIDGERVELFLKDYLLDISNENNTNEKLKLLVKGEDIRLKNKDAEYYLNTFNAHINDENISFNAFVKNLDIPLSKNDKKVTSLNLEGSLSKERIKIKTLDDSLRLEIIGENRIDLDINSYDVLVDLKSEEESEFDIINLKAKNSNLIINKDFKFLANSYEFRLKEDTSKYLHLMHKKTDVTYKQSKEGKIDIYANDISDEFVNTIFKKQIVEGGKLMFIANGFEHNLKGKTIFTNVKIKDLAIINNLLIFIHSSPALINPLLAVPSVVSMASNKGFNLTGYKIIDGVLEFVYDNKKKNLDVNKLVTVGNGIDFDGKGKVDLNNMTLDSKIKLIFFKDYSSIVGSIPVVNYVLLGENKRVATQVNIFGDLKNPKISTNLTKDAFSVPVNIGKRVLESPIKLFEFIKDLGDK
ncbi:AsmA-like C-terminal domain-containing protein [Arcobacter roscoffensis]|uniref:AsmA-like C-terminal domain-containing protein n=1 Tax=Arcobacter roscoffensis TaxID=2961520 RepID=A0ABY5E1S6_9BACT|nr:AsmA-like C-terminal domain-containing protein [Arcobacter roscoffensis]UTJ05427.1 AsmA-like C-terminal domain-containing protein [Arcobacter roscoffensis]